LFEVILLDHLRVQVFRVFHWHPKTRKLECLDTYCCINTEAHWCDKGIWDISKEL